MTGIGNGRSRLTNRISFYFYTKFSRLFPIHSLFRKYSPVHFLKKAGAALVRTITSIFLWENYGHYYYNFYYYYYEILSRPQFLLFILSHIPAPSCSSEMQHLSENMCCSNKADIWVHPVIFDILRFSCHFTKSFKTVLRGPITMLIVVHSSNPQKSPCPQTYSLLSWLWVVPSVLTYGKSSGHPHRTSASAFLTCASMCTPLCFVTTEQLSSDRV